jgi:anti-sigma regulatory factor (Ser/Thr protein kinase)
MVPREKVGALAGELGADASRVGFADMTDAGRNPGRIISYWADFAGRHRGRRMRGVGEPIWAGRRDDELMECQHHESLINLAFKDAAGFRLVCPYDTESLSGAVIDEAHRTHPHIAEDDGLRRSGDYSSARAHELHQRALPYPDAPTLEVVFDEHSLGLLRRFVRDQAEVARLRGRRADDLVMAVNEVASNSVRHGGGSGYLRTWTNEAALVCEVRDSGLIDQPDVGRVRPDTPIAGGHGLWLAHQVCDLVQVRSSHRGTSVRLQMRF